MSESCPNCGKPVLPTDTACWHCGHPLPRRPKARPPAKPAAGPRLLEHGEPATEAADYDFRALAVYGLLTLVALIALLLVMRALGRQPLLVRSAAVAAGDWVAVTDADLRYTLSLPADWQWLDVAYREQEDVLEQVIDRQPYVGQALAPLGRAAGDVTIVGVSAGTPDLTAEAPVPFVVVGRSAALADETPAAALDRLSQSDLPITETKIDTRLAGQPQARFNVLDAPNGYQCRHLFVAGPADPGAAGYLVAACAPQAAYGALTLTLSGILDSFQLLQE